MSIIARDIIKVYEPQLVLDSVSFELQKGEIAGLLGPNGAGKSTLMKILTGYIPATSGEAVINGHSVVNEPIEVKQSLGYLPEHNPLYLDLYVEEYLEFAAGLHRLGKQAKSRIKEVVELTGLGPEKHKKIGMLSKGYRQRVGLAQALVHDPRVLILDEPTAGLDPNQLLEIRNLIKELGKEKTILFSTHIMQEVEALCKRTIIINKGKIVADSPTDLLPSLVSQDVVKVEFDKPVKPEALLQIEGIEKALSENGTQWLLHAKKGEEIRPAVGRFAVNNQIGLLSLYKVEQNLEQVFHELTVS